MKNPKWAIRKSTDKQFYFTLQAANGEIVLISEMYQTKAGAYNGIESIMENANSLIYDTTVEDDTDQD